MTDFIVSPEIQQALDAGRPIVALESALITHGFAYPANLDITLRMAAAIRDEGAVPAVTGVWGGCPMVGLSDAQIEDWRTLVQTRLKEMDWDRVRADVSPFLERTEDTSLLTRENLLSLLDR